MSSIVRRLKVYIDYKGITIAAFERSNSMSNASFAKAVKNNGAIGSDKLENILIEYPEINHEWLLTGEGEMLKRDGEYSELKPRTRMVNDRQQIKEFRRGSDRSISSQQVPLYDIAASAGLVSLFIDSTNQTPIDYISIPNLPLCDGAIYVTGDSMYPLLKAGDIVMYKQISDIVNNIFYGEMYMVSFDVDGEEYIMIKYIQRSDLPDHIKLVSDNRHHAPFELHLSRLRAMALIKASIRINSIK